MDPSGPSTIGRVRAEPEPVKNRATDPIAVGRAVYSSLALSLGRERGEERDKTSPSPRELNCLALALVKKKINQKSKIKN